MIPDSLKTSSELHRECIAACGDSYRCCMETIVHCIDVNGEHNEPVHLKLLIDCADICGFTLQFLLRGSAHAMALCALCSTICRTCADSCDAFGEQRMSHCADVMRRCADACDGIVRETAQGRNPVS
jgi:hypothetical protein